MRKALVLFSVLLLLGIFVYGQETGSIRGKVVDKDGNPLPGVNITLSGAKTATLSTVTSAEGNFRFLSLDTASDYTLKFELQGFKPIVRSQLVVSYGRDINLDLTMDQAALEETVTVVGQTPIIDTKKTQVGVNITGEMIMRLPTARDPWVLMQLSPGMMVDRENVGGSDSGQQSGYYGHGSSAGDSTWNVDGANITDTSALGSAPAYLNMAGFEEILINYGNNDVRSQTGGVQLNFITKRGGNAFSGMFYMDASKGAWQSTNLPPGLPEDYTGAGIDKIYLYGLNFGGPVLKDKLWFYGSYGIQDLGTHGITGVADNTFLESGYFRLDAQVTKSTRLNGFYEYDNKQKWGRTGWGAAQQAPETVYNQVGPTPIYKGEIEQLFGNLFLNAKVAYTHNVFHLIPKLGPRTPDGSGPYEVRDYQPSFYVSGNVDDYNTVRPMTSANLYGNYFAEKVLGADHEIKFGVDYTQSKVQTYDLYEGNLIIARWSEDDWTEAWVIRDFYLNFNFDRISFFAQDTMTFGRLTVGLGLRYDVENSVVASTTQPAAPLMSNYLGELSINTFDPGMRSKIFSPRLSLVYDITGDGKNVVKLNLAQYGSQTGYEFAGFLNPVPWAEIDLRWVDANSDGRVTQNELWGTDWETGEPTADPNDPDGWSWYGGFDPANPGVAESTNMYDPNYKTPLLDELSLSYERVAEAQSHYHLVTPEQVEDLRARADQIDMDRALQIEAEIKHDLMAEIKTFAEQCPVGGGIIHLGATSMDIEDNADALRLRQSLDLIIAKCEAMLETFAAQIERWADTPTMAFTHIQPAEPTTVGYRLAQYAQDVLTDYAELARVRAGIRGKGFKGAVGTSASYLELTLAKVSKPLQGLESLVMRALDLEAFDATTQTYPRKQDWLVLNALAGLAMSLNKFAFDVRVLQSPPIGEWSEPFGAKQVGSSAMPFKRNPINAEKIDSLARYLAQLPRIAWDNAAHSLLERTLDDSANRRTALPEAFLCADELLMTAQRLIKGLVIDETSIARNFAVYAPFAATERLLMASVKAGADRQELHEVIREHSMQAWAEVKAGRANPLIDALCADERITRHLDPQTAHPLLDARDYVGDAPQRARWIAKKIRGLPTRGSA